MTFLLVTCRLIKLRFVKQLRNKSTAQILLGIASYVDLWKGFGFKPAFLSFDNEPALVHAKDEIFAKHGLRMDFVAPGAHEKVAERDVGTVKRLVYTNIMDLGHAVDQRMVRGIVEDTIRVLNFLPNSETGFEAPRAFLDGERLDMGRWSRCHAGQVGEFTIPYPSGGDRKEICYVLSHSGDNARVRILPGGEEVTRSGRFTPMEKTPAIIAMIEQSISGARRQQYNDLLSEIKDYEEEYHRDGSLLLEDPSTYAPSQLQSAPPQPQSAGPTAAEPHQGSTPVIDPTTSDPLSTAPSSAPALGGTLTPVAPADFTAIEALRQQPQQPPQATVRPAANDVTPAVPDPPTTVPASPLEPAMESGASRPQRTPYRARYREDSSVVNLPPTRPVRAAAQHPPGFYSELGRRAGRQSNSTDCLPETAFREPIDVHHMYAEECARLFGRPRQEAAGIAEVMNVIGSGGLEPVDYRKLTADELKSALPSLFFYKDKDLLPEELAKQRAQSNDPSTQSWQTVESKRAKRESKVTKEQQKRGEKVKIKARWVGGGHKQKKPMVLGDKVAPTARSAAHSILLAIAAHSGSKPSVGDVPTAYLKAMHPGVSEDGSPLYIVADRETARLILLAYPDLSPLVRPNGTMVLRVVKALYGLIESAWLWYKELVSTFEGLGYELLESDRGVLAKNVYKGKKRVGFNFVSLHVDDILSVPSNNDIGRGLSNELWDFLEANGRASSFREVSTCITWALTFAWIRSPELLIDHRGDPSRRC